MRLSKIFLGANGLRAGWWLLIFLAVIDFLPVGFREAVVHTPILTRMIKPLREGRLVVSGALIAEIQFVTAGRCVRDGKDRKALPRGLWSSRSRFPWPMFLARRCMRVVGRHLPDVADLCFRRASIRRLGFARQKLGGVRRGVGDCVPLGWVFRRVSAPWLRPIYPDCRDGFWPSAILLSVVSGLVHLGSLGENWGAGRGEMIVTRTLSPASWRKPSEMAAT